MTVAGGNHLIDPSSYIILYMKHYEPHQNELAFRPKHLRALRDCLRWACGFSRNWYINNWSYLFWIKNGAHFQIKILARESVYITDVIASQISLPLSSFLYTLWFYPSES